MQSLAHAPDHHQRLAGAPRHVLPKPEEIVDDRDIRVDDRSLESLLWKQAELKQKLDDMNFLQKRMESKHELLKRVQRLKHQKQSTLSEEDRIKEAKERSAEEYNLALQKRNATNDERDSIARERRKLDKLLNELKAERGNTVAELQKMEDESKRANEKEANLKKEYDELMASLEGVVDKFRNDGFHTWLQQNLDAVPPVMRETILKTSSALNPLLDGVDEVASLNEKLTNETADVITRYVPGIKDSPFYTGLIFYMILLFPTVVALWLVLKVRARLSQLTVEHYLIALNLYFGSMSTVCAVMTITGGVDVLIVFRHRSLHVAEPFMLVHGLLFVVHLVMHGMTAYISGSRKDFAQYICMSCIGLHFFMHAYKRTILGQDPNIGGAAYVLYAGVFLYTLYDRGVHIIEAAINGRKSGVSEFGTYPSELHMKADGTPPASGGEGASDSTVYFAGLPVFNRPSQTALNEAKTI